MSTAQQPLSQPATLVIFGITGDLARRKLLPALYYLTKHDLLPKPFKIVGVTRRGIAVADLLKTIQENVEKQGKPCEQAALKRLGDSLEIVTMDLLKTDDYRTLRKRLDAIETEVGVCMNRLYYLAIPAQTYEPVVRELGAGGLNHSCPHGTGAARLLIEKPFGYDLASAHELIAQLNEHFIEAQIYRIDHYLAKETVQNILAFRFQNPLFRRVWDNSAISHITITAAEEIDIEGRATFYEQTGALRDFVQSHLLQLLAVITMDEPATLTAEKIHQQKLALLQAVKPIAPNAVATQTVRGQYAGYRDDVQDAGSITETYAALRLNIDTPRWRGTPILVRTGKALAEKTVEISVIFSDSSTLTGDNTLTFSIQPTEGIAMQLLAKKPGFANETEPVHMEFCYNRAFKTEAGHPDAYERVLIDAFRGDKTLFATSDEVLAAWRVLENVINEWAKNDNGLHVYERGSWGPEAADQLAESAGATWPTHHRGLC
jgi:glucose-6-phosphate 1-dehydrogenase